MRVELVLLDGNKMEFDFDKDSITFGRSNKCDVVIPHESMSRLHCQIDLKNGEFFVTDLGSSNGVLIDEKKIEPHKPILLQTFLNLSFGYVSSCHLSLSTQEKDPTQTFRPLFNSPGPSPLAEKNSPSQSPPPKKRSMLIGNLLALIILAAAIYYYYHYNSNSSPEPITSEKENTFIEESDLF